ncbi:MAG: heme exporter protein CcmB [Thalassobaculales bacterium]
MSAFLALLRRDLRLAWRDGGDAGLVLAFYVLAVVLFPFGVGPEPGVLARIAAGVVWVTALFAAMLSLERMYAADHAEGTLEQLALSPLPLAAVAAAKALSHWLTTGLPLALLAPFLALLLRLDDAALPALVASMLLGTPSLSLLGGVGAALALGARRAGVLVPLLVLPLCIPVLIFAVAAVEAAATGQAARPHLLLLAACLAAALPLCPLAAAAGLRQAL